jgi:hypothetical protein
VPYLGAAVYTGDEPVNSGASKPSNWIFDRWEPEPVNITGDTDCYAKFRFNGSYARELLSGNLEGEYVNDRVETIGDFAFCECKKLTSATFTKATLLRYWAFRSNSNLSRVDFHVLKEINTDAECFLNSKLDTLILRGDSMVTMICGYAYVSMLKNTPIANGTGYIYVHKVFLSDDDATKDYRRATNWSTYGTQFRAIEDYPDICGGE